ncbi:MAG: cytochrome c3 family protein [Candidatus Polarisedimenticolia bacterium]
MAQIFHRSFNVISRLTIYGALFVMAFLAWVIGTLDRSAYLTNADTVREQPVQFSHKHHVSGLGIDCRYCHTSVETSSFAGIPPTQTCMTCHSQIWTEAPVLEPVRASWRENAPLRWTRVNDLPDFVYFNHSIHIHKGIGCASCHGQVDQMPLMYQEHPLLMEWCLDCHRHPEKFVRPREEIFNMEYLPPADQAELGSRLVREYDVRPSTDCSRCHR